MAFDGRTAAFADDAVASALAQKNRAFEACYNAGDAQALVEIHFVPERIGPMACPPGGQQPVIGRAALIALFARMIADAPFIALRSEDVVISGEMAFELGRATLTLNDGTSAIGRFTVCWVRDGGEWWAKTDFFAEDGWGEPWPTTLPLTGGQT